MSKDDKSKRPFKTIKVADQLPGIKGTNFWTGFNLHFFPNPFYVLYVERDKTKFLPDLTDDHRSV